MAAASLTLKINPDKSFNLGNCVFSPHPNKPLLHPQVTCTNLSSFDNAALHLKNNNIIRTLSGSTFTKKSRSRNGFDPVCVTGSNRDSASAHSFDVVIVGAGIIGLSIAREFLLRSNLSVALVDSALPCAGATGAGQGYIWRVHKMPGSEKWELSMRSYHLWESLAESIQRQGMDPSEILGWKKTGSLLVGKTAKEAAILKGRVEKLCNAGVGAQFLSSEDLISEEPSLVLGKEGGAVFVPDDCQLDARRTVAFIEKNNRQFATQGRYAEFYHEPAISLIRQDSDGGVEAVQTSKNTLYSKKAVIVAAGCWSGSLMHELINHAEIDLDLPVKPRKGHLLVIEQFKSFKLNHGLMEAGYVNHDPGTLQSSNSDLGPAHDQTLSVSMTATKDMLGNLVLGSSRQFIGFSTEIDERILNLIWDRAGEFFPTLKELSLRDLMQSRELRVGLRPYMPDGKPMIGVIPGLSNVYIAAGHEGEGLSMALGTAELIVDMVLDNPRNIDPAPFAIRGR